MGQPLRPSEFILSYGVGSIIEAPRGPRLIPAFDKWDLARTVFSGSGNVLSKFRIDDRNARAQLSGSEIFEIPTNPQFDLTTNQSLFRTLRFPKWALCQQHRVLYQLDVNGRSRCPGCRGKLRDSQDEAIRFVRACPTAILMMLIGKERSMEVSSAQVSYLNGLRRQEVTLKVFEYAV